MDHDSELFVEYLASRPINGVVRWASDHVSPDKPWATRWVDVRAMDADAPSEFNWAWTIVGADDTDGCDPENLLYFEWPYDLDVYEVWAPPEPPATMPRLVSEVPFPRGFPPPPIVAPHPQYLAVMGGWTVATLTTALEGWAEAHAGRPDLHFSWERAAGESDTLTQVRERAETGGPFWNLGGGLIVHDGVVDDLLRAARPGRPGA